MIITLDNLRVGLTWFRTKWGPELIKPLYYEIYDAQASGITEDWWRSTVQRLNQLASNSQPKTAKH